MKLSGWKYITLIVSILLAATGMLAYPAWILSKQLRAELLASQSRELANEANFRQAYDRAFSAHLFDTDNEEILLNLARIAVKAERTDVMKYWNPLIADSELIQVDDLEALANHLNSISLDEDLLKVLMLIQQRDSRNPVSRKLLLEKLLDKGDFATVRQLTSAWVDDGSQQEEVLYAYATAFYNSMDVREREKGYNFLLDLSERKDTVGLRSLRVLVISGGLNLESTIEKLGAHPEASLEDRSFVVSWNSANGKYDTFAEANEAMKNIHEEFETELSESLSYLKWLEREKQFSKIHQLLNFEKIKTNTEITKLFLNSLISDDKPSEALEYLLDRSSGIQLRDASNYIIRSRAFAVQGEIESSQTAIDLAIENLEIEDFSEIENELSRLEKWDGLADLYRRLEDSSATAEFTQTKKIFASYYLGKEAELAHNLAKLPVDAFEGNIGISSFILYLKFLYNESDRLAVGIQLESMLLKNPYAPEPRLVLALVHSFAGNPSISLEYGKGLYENPDSSYGRYLNVICQYLQHLDERIEAEKLLNTDDLLPRERAMINL